MNFDGSMPMSISEIKNRIRQHIQIIDDPDDVADLLGISAETLRKQFRTEEHDRLWIFILKEKVKHFLEDLPPYPTGGNGQFPNAQQVIDAYRSVLPGPDRTWFRDVREMIALINDNPFDFNLNVNWIRNELNIPPNMYTQKFYFFTRMHVTEYIRWHRLVMAKYLLSHSSLKIGGIALLVGYNSLSAFSKAFAQNVGSSPKVYRATHLAHPSPSSAQPDLVQKTKAVAAESESLQRKSLG
ncbi:MAG: helix-turn-helix transcriptional regulator [Bacteroidetes bacterium SB0662_bin_6]|nr:helix-turn-helix transcriptional regulator [Bacteroidetes bacterium SB0662_bin_6]